MFEDDQNFIANKKRCVTEMLLGTSDNPSWHGEPAMGDKKGHFHTTRRSQQSITTQVVIVGCHHLLPVHSAGHIIILFERNLIDGRLLNQSRS